MKEHLSSAATAISNGSSVSDVVEELLSERMGKSVYRPTSRVSVPLPWGTKELRIPGGLTGLGAAAGGSYLAYKAHKRAKEARLKGRAYAKYVGKHALKGAASGALSGYIVQLGQRAGFSRRAGIRHAKSKVGIGSSQFRSPGTKPLTRKLARARSLGKLKKQGILGKTGSASWWLGMGKRVAGL